MVITLHQIFASAAFTTTHSRTKCPEILISFYLLILTENQFSKRFMRVANRAKLCAFLALLGLVNRNPFK